MAKKVKMIRLKGTIDSKIKKLGGSFRGLWRRVIVNDLPINEFTEGWAVTYVMIGQIVETEYFDNAHGALDDAIITKQSVGE